MWINVCGKWENCGRFYREKNKVTQEEIAKAIGMNRNAYSRMEREGKRITFEAINGIAEYLGIDADLILYGEKENPLDLTPPTPKPLGFSDPGKDNPFEPQIVLGYKYGDNTFSVLEEQIIECYRSLDKKGQQEFLDYINKLKNWNQTKAG